MKKISVMASSPYQVLVGFRILEQLGQLVKEVSGAVKIAIISDSHVWPLYGRAAVESLNKAGYSDVFSFIFEAGEQSKNGQTFLRALEFLAEKQITRSDCIIALGGGVVGDLAGFTAACYLRGIDYIQVPTSLLACVDSSVGGKTAIDLSAGKNLAGAFYQPKLVLCDMKLLESLPEAVFREGCAEVIKYGILFDRELFSHLQKNALDFDREWVISRCVQLKRDVVAEDEFDRGARQKLNLGHTVGHGIEKASNFAVSHGEAVAMGMAIVARAAAKYGICTSETAVQIISVLEAFGLSVSTRDSADSIYQNTLSDKKRMGQTIHLIVPKCIGNCQILPMDINKVKEFIEAGL